MYAEKDMKLKERMIKIAAVCGVAGIVVLGGTTAYLTDYDSAVNEFTVGKVEIDLQEPNWEPDENVDIEPSEDIAKDPQIKNTGVNDCFAYLEVSVPMAEVTTADKEGNRIEKKLIELFSYTKDAGWTQLEAKTLNGYKVYTYCYNKVLKPNETTAALFKTVTFANIIEGQLDTQHLEIPIRAYAIQTVNTGGDIGTIVQQATTAFQKYVKQNAGQSGAVSS